MLAMYFERLNNGLPLYGAMARPGLLESRCLKSVGFSLKYRDWEYRQFDSCFSFYSPCWVFLKFNVRSTVKVVVAFLDVVFFVENDCSATFICWKDSHFFFQRVKNLSVLSLKSSGPPDLSWLLCYQLQLSACFSIRFQLWQQCLLLGNFLEQLKSSNLFHGEIMFSLRG